MKTIRLIWLNALVVLMVSCAHLIPPVSPDFKPDGNTSVLYARLNLEDKISLGNRIALWLQNVDSTNFLYIYFEKKQPVYAITVDPGNYRLMGFAGIDMTHRILDRSVFRDKDSKKEFVMPFQVPANRAVYIGDFTGYAKVNLVEEEWALRAPTNNFAQTTVDFHQHYTNLASLPVTSAFDGQP